MKIRRIITFKLLEQGLAHLSTEDGVLAFHHHKKTPEIVHL